MDVQLPVNLNYSVGSELRRVPFDGQTVGTSQAVSSPSLDGNDWSSLRDGFVQDGKVHYFGGAGAFYSRPFSNSAIGAVTNLSTSVGYVDLDSGQTQYGQPYGVTETNVATYHNGRIYYTRNGDSKLYSRGYSLESGIIDSRQEVASGRDFSGATALDFIGDWLYAASSDGKLYRFPAPDGKIQYDNRQLADNGATINWANVGGLFSTTGSGAAVQPIPPAPLNCDTSSPWKADYWSNRTLTGSPDTSRCEGPINYNYGSGGPAGTSVGPDNFSARWVSSVTLTERASIKVDGSSDDGLRAYVDGERVINSWNDQAATAATGTSMALEPGKHTIRIEYYEATGDASVSASYSVVGAAPVDPGPDNTPADTTVTTPAGNEVLSSNDITITGGATDDRSVDEVRVAILNRNDQTNRWLQADGTFGPQYRTRSATLSARGTPSTDWSLSLNLPEGSYAADVVAVDAKGNVDPTSAYRPFTVKLGSGGAADTERPTVTVTSPTNGQTVATTSVTASGNAADNVGVDAVRVAVYNRDGDASTRWLQADGTWGPTYTSRPATLGTPGAKSTSWSQSFTLSDGRYAFDVRSRDKAGNEPTSSVFQPFVVNTAPTDTVKPGVQVTTPARNSEQTGNPVQTAGTATDDQGVTQVRVAVYNREDATNRWLQPDGTWGPAYNFYKADMANPGATSTSWSIPVNLPTGRYAIDAKAQDAKGNLSTSDYVPFTVAVADNSAPRTSMQASPSARSSARSVSLQGLALDNQAVRKVEVQVLQKVVKRVNRNGTVRKTVKKRYLRSNGTWRRKAGFYKTEINEDLATKTGWRLGFALPKAAGKVRYIVKVRAVDANGNYDKTPVKAKYVTRGR